MLKEIDKPRQVQGEPRRRWFEDSESDLIVWTNNDGVITGFQFCYDKGNVERALTWKRGEGFVHERVDDGEGRPIHHKSTPILSADGDFDVATVSSNFRKRSIKIDANITSFVLDKLAEYGEEGACV